MDSPLLSVCLITYNHAEYISEAIAGVLMQNVNFSWELIIADDFSTDGTREIILDYQSKHPDFIRLILQKKNVGAAQNWFDLMKYPKSKYIAYFEGDDYWTDSDKLQKQVDILEKNSNIVAVVTNASKCDENGKIIDNIGFDITCNDQTNIINLNDFFKKSNHYPTPTVMFRNDIDCIIEQFKYLINPYLGDWILWVLLHTKGDFFYLDEMTACYRINPKSITHTVNAINRWKYDFIIREKLKNVIPKEYHKYLNENWYAYLRIATAYRKQNKYFSFYLNLFQSFLSNPIKFFKEIYKIKK